MSPKYDTAQHTHLLCSLAILFATGCTNLSESRFLVPKDEEPDMKPAVTMEEPDSRPDMPEEEDMRPELDMRDDGKCTRVSDCKTDLPNVVASCDSNGRCNYQCSTDEEQTWAIIQNHVIDVNGCNCEVLPEICNGEDEDCDGVPDNDLALECEVQDGVCAGALNYCNGDSDSFNSSCSDETYREHATSNGFFFSDNIYESHRCDGLDNNCDGRVDEACCASPDDKLIFAKSSNSGDAPFKILNNHSVPNSFLILNTNNGLIQLTSNSQTDINEPPAFDADYLQDEGDNAVLPIVNNVIEIESDIHSRPGLRDGFAQLKNGKFYQSFASGHSEFYHIAVFDPTNLEASIDHLGHQLMWLPIAPNSNETQHHPHPLLESSNNNVFLGGWVDTAESNTSQRNYEFRACIGSVLEQDCVINSITYNNEFESPLQTAVAGLQNGNRFMLAMHTNNNSYQYTVYNATTRQEETTQEITLPSQANEERKISGLQVMWVSSTHVLLAQHAWYSAINTNQIELFLLNTATTSEAALLTHTTIPLETTNTESSVELVMTQTLEDQFVVLWSENSTGINSSQVSIGLNDTLSTSAPRLFPTLAEGINRELVDATYNGRHLGILVTESSDLSPGKEIAQLLIASPEGAPLCKFRPNSPTD